MKFSDINTLYINLAIPYLTHTHTHTHIYIDRKREREREREREKQSFRFWSERGRVKTQSGRETERKTEVNTEKDRT
jgi:hypothetical protein